ncbi:hypothetical protein [Spongiivirga citrea]|uniref:Uncharacterized protein n=1 Tax=Spongiivirga citrea TaxID=1481457 RepID=A0A6M0CEH8_9FLAO|nr:hypothetical protein [Spongiivirga citrea]NER16151.1 hypothetical protein [Spongiivirga citrea]
MHLEKTIFKIENKGGNLGTKSNSIVTSYFMINPSKFGIYTIGAIFLFLIGCQEDIPDIEERPVISLETITVDSDLFTFIKNTSANDGRVDNLIDDYNCGELVYPVTVTVNGEQLTLTSDDGISQVQAIFDRSTADYDFVTFTYPISFLNDDHTIDTIASEADFDALIQECERDFQLGALTCLDFTYPLFMITFDQAKQTSDNFRLETDKQLFDFMVALAADNEGLELNQQEIASLLYPVEVTLEDGEMRDVANGTELETLLEAIAADDCFTPDGLILDDSAFRALLDADDFVIKSYIEGTNDRTVEFSTNNVTFNTDGTLQVDNGGTNSSGNWSLERDYSSLELDLDFNDTTLNGVFDRDWDLIQLNDLEFDIRFRDQFLTLRRVRATTPPELNTLFASAGWQVSNYTTAASGDQTILFNQRVFTFSSNGELRAAINNAGVEGTWQVTIRDQFDLSLAMTFEDIPPFTQIATSWQVLNYNDDQITLELFNAGTLEATLVFDKL